MSDNRQLKRSRIDHLLEANYLKTHKDFQFSFNLPNKITFIILSDYLKYIILNFKLSRRTYPYFEFLDGLFMPNIR